MHERTQKNESRSPIPDTRSLSFDLRPLIPGPCLSAPGQDHVVLQKHKAAIQDSSYLSAQRKRLTAAFGPSHGVAQRAENKTGIPDEVKARMESAFNTDFSGVRVHPESSVAPAVQWHSFKVFLT